MKKTFQLVVFTLISFTFSCSDEPKYVNENPEFNTFNKLPITSIKPAGWIKEFLIRQKTGLTGNIEVAGYPFNTCLWACEKMEGSTKAWWPYEQTAYYIDGVHRLGYLLGDEELLAKAHVNTDYVMNHIDSVGRIGTNLADRWQRWPYASFLRNYMTDFSLSESQEIVNMMHKHYLTFDANDFADDLELANVEQLCWLYGVTKDKRMLIMAEKAYALFKSNIDFRNRAGSNIEFGSDRNPDHHVVVYLELVKIPAILYSHTGNQTYLEEALNGIQKLEEHSLLAAGLPNSTEHFGGISETAGVETCNAAVFPYTYGYFMQITGDAQLGDKIEKAVFNGGIGAVDKQFKSHQYFSMPNQVIATSTSNPFGHNPARMAYLPGHDVECCTGNVNRFMPYYVEQMWMQTPDNGIVAALFGPSVVEAEVGDGKTLIKITESTNYPFSDKIKFSISTDKEVKFPFLIRIPSWSKNTEILVNNKPVKVDIQSNSFFKLERIFNNGDVITLNMPTEITTSNWPNNGVVVERGPLVYSLPINADKTVLEGYERSTKEFPGWELIPNSDWNYGIDVVNASMEIVNTGAEGYPWDEGQSPLKIRVEVKQLPNWKLDKLYDDQWKMEVVRTPGFPEERETSQGIETIELVPYGATMLRLTVFPTVNASD